MLTNITSWKQPLSNLHNTDVLCIQKHTPHTYCLWRHNYSSQDRARNNSPRNVQPRGNLISIPILGFFKEFISMGQSSNKHYINLEIWFGNIWLIDFIYGLVCTDIIKYWIAYSKSSWEYCLHVFTFEQSFRSWPNNGMLYIGLWASA